MKSASRPAGRRDFLRNLVKPKATAPMTLRTGGHGDQVSLLGFGMMRLPTVDGKHANMHHGGSKAAIDREEVQAQVDYALAHGVNYFDTSPAYCRGESEDVTGEALARHPREQYRIATKLSNFSPKQYPLEKCQELYEASRKFLRTDVIDYYLLHAVGMGGFDTFKKRYVENGAIDFCLRERDAGRIRNLGFSFHGDKRAWEWLMERHEKYHWDFVQIQLNYADWKEMSRGWGGGSSETSSEYLYNYLVGKGIPVLVMEPVKGGALANVSDALRDRMRERHPNLTPAGNALSFVGSLPGVMVTLSGMSNMQQLKENVALFTGFKPFDEADMAFMEETADLYKANIHVPCTACSYCMPCPNGVDIPGNFKVFNTTSDELSIPDPENKDKDYRQKRKLFLKRYNELGKDKIAGACIDCNACLPKCPQRIRIPDQLHMISDLVKSLG
jgi:predicted aldo/keto reductase-like oxidoreductase